MTDYFLLTQIIIIILLIAFSAFFSSSETALTALSESVLQKRISEGNIEALKTKKLLLKKEMVISAILLGNNLVNILSSALATNIFIKEFGSMGILYSTVTMTILIFVFAEVLPKIYAIRKADTLAIKVSPLIEFIVWFLTPINKIVHKFVKVIINIKNKNSSKLDMDRLRGAILLAGNEGGIMKDNKTMLEGVLDLESIDISEIMVHRSDVYSIDINKNKKYIIKNIIKSSFSRIPVWKDNPDNIIGILHVKDLLKLINLNKEFNIKTIVKKPWFVPEQTSLSSQLKAFREKKKQLAIVVDEYGTLQGLVTLEDILEEIVGQINDEHDEPSKEIISDKEGNKIVKGNVSIRDLNRIFNWKLPDEEAATIAGLLINHSKRIPQKGETFIIGSFIFSIVNRVGTRLTKIKVTKVKK